MQSVHHIRSSLQISAHARDGVASGADARRTVPRCASTSHYSACSSLQARPIGFDEAVVLGAARLRAGGARCPAVYRCSQQILMIRRHSVAETEYGKLVTIFPTMVLL